MTDTPNIRALDAASMARGFADEHMKTVQALAPDPWTYEAAKVEKELLAAAECYRAAETFERIARDD